ncbi:MAG: class 1 fructose-bisphosphatase [Acidiphilium sp.]|nr:class 1 fructose-bisphosphatase [Acidiphilium sp.]MDD4935350.1 class 1 fructose-bisphosphatase [Acidiphilium sp.]
MADQLRLDSYLDFAAGRSTQMVAVCQTVHAIAAAGRQISRILARGPLAGNLGTIVGDSIDGDGQKALDAMTHTILREALARAPVSVFASEEADKPEVLDEFAPLAVAVDPLDGSSNIDTLAPIGTIFSVMPGGTCINDDPAAPFLQPGRNQMAAGFLIYGPRTALVLTLGAGTRIFTLDPDSGAFIATHGEVVVPHTTREYAINGSNLRHWDPEIHDYILELKKGRNGPRGEDFNTRWLASMVGDAFRILSRGGIYLYPADQRRGYREGRLRLIYEANPIAMIMEQAGAAATDGQTPILDLVPTAIHQRCPLVFGSADEVGRVADAYRGGGASSSPLFKTRSLFRKNTSTIGSLS